MDGPGAAAALDDVAGLASKPALIAFAEVGKSFGAIEAVRSISLDVRPGEVVTLVGPSGCGKSTLLNMTAGLMAPTTGSVAYAGVPVKGINQRVGYMTQNDHLLPWRTIARNVEVALEIRGERKAQRRRRVDELLALVGLEGFGGHYPTQVSGGMRKRAALARLLAYDPETLLMDEPFGALDAQLRLTLQSELLGLQRRFSKTVLFVTHDLDEAIALADRCVVFTGRPGTIRKVIETGLPRERNLMELRFDERFIELSHELWTTMAPEIRPKKVQRS